jgi:hypothetical protein
MNQDSIQPGEMRELSLHELDAVTGGNTNVSFGPLRVSVGNGELYIGLKGLGTLWLYGTGGALCGPGGTCGGAEIP